MGGVAVDAHWADLDALAGAASSFHDLLDDEERARAARFHFGRDRRRFVLRRGLLRVLLAGHLGLDPASVRFTRTPAGKPSLRAGEPRFSASHSHGLALCAVAWGTEVGCDIERRDGRIDADGTAAALFAPGEVRALRRLPPGPRQSAFYQCWTLKEAYVKAIGSSLWHGLDGFDTSAPGGAPAGWSAETFEPRPSYHAAVVSRGEGIELTVRPCRADRTRPPDADACPEAGRDATSCRAPRCHPLPLSYPRERAPARDAPWTPHVPPSNR